ncbi:hypothetical protein OS493_019290 [Desmophyllum pertusum]|uniref:G-protein coupled receptors family 1 profile domain-containing protein n=1 Tax=Desmophyllum pertusum TaxID=174260 RepID=A0A9W9YDF4_9CNID|nr:hypothetical protein OS493_019290 [Desmophyllum pertusum]
MAYVEFNNSFNITSAINGTEEYTSQKGCFHHDTTATRVIRVVVYCVIFMVSALGNYMTIMVVRRDKNMQKAFHCFIVNLATTDLIITLVLYAASHSNVVKRKWMVSGRHFWLSVV